MALTPSHEVEQVWDVVLQACPTGQAALVVQPHPWA
jgi:hypothetical protein